MLLGINSTQLKRHTLPVYHCWPCPALYDHSVIIFLQLCSRVCVMSQSSLLLSLISWTWKWVHCLELASTVTISESSAAPLGCVGTRDSHYGCAANKHTACCHFNVDQKLWGMLPAPRWRYAMKNEQISYLCPLNVWSWWQLNRFTINQQALLFIYFLTN